MSEFNFQKIKNVTMTSVVSMSPGPGLGQGTGGPLGEILPPQVPAPHEWKVYLIHELGNQQDGKAGSRG